MCCFSQVLSTIVGDDIKNKLMICARLILINLRTDPVPTVGFADGTKKEEIAIANLKLI